MCQTKEGCGARTHLGGGGEGESGLVTRRMSPTTLSKRVRCQGLPKGGVRLQSMFGDGERGWDPWDLSRPPMSLLDTSLPIAGRG